MEIRCVKGMYRLKLISCENNSGFKLDTEYRFLRGFDNRSS